MKFQTLRHVLCMALLGNSVAAFSQDSTRIFTLSGSIDTYYRTAFKTTNDYGADGPSTAFADLKGFSLGMVNLIASYQGEKAGFVADVVFGPRGQASVFRTASRQRIVNQAYAYYKFFDAFTLNFGQFNTFLGYEAISPVLNFNYSTSYLCTGGPFNHTGLRADFDFGEGMVAKLAIMNPTDFVEFNPVNTYTFGAQIGKTGNFGGVWFNFLYGDQDGTLKEDEFTGSPNPSAGRLFQFDITAGFNISETFYLGLNASHQTVAAGEEFTGGGAIVDIDGDASSFTGIALYPKLTLSKTFALGVRGEYFMTKNYHFGGGDGGGIIKLDEEGDGNVMEFTLSANYKVGGFTLIPEFRIDITSEDSFSKKNGEATSMMPSLIIAAVYQF